MTQFTDMNYKPCEKLDGKCVDAFAELKTDLDNYNDTTLVLSSTWGDSPLDLKPLIKAGETVTTLYLTPTNAPVSLQFDKEDGTHDCIEGQDLSRIISMRYLKDVKQTAPSQGIVYKYNNSTSLFEPFNLDAYMTTVNNRLSTLETNVAANTSAIGVLNTTVNAIQEALNNLATRVTNLEGDVATLKTQMANVLSRLNTIEALLAKPAGTPNNIKIAWGNINIYGDNTNTGAKTSGLYTHNPSTNVTNDLQFS